MFGVAGAEGFYMKVFLLSDEKGLVVGCCFGFVFCVGRGCSFFYGGG